MGSEMCIRDSVGTGRAASGAEFGDGGYQFRSGTGAICAHSTTEQHCTEGCRKNEQITLTPADLPAKIIASHEVRMPPFDGQYIDF